MSSSSSLTFTVRRQEPRLVVPAKLTPCELKPLSDIDDQQGLRFQVPVIMFYRKNPSKDGEDPAKIIEAALAETLVFYYPFAGRLIEASNRKLMVACTGEGVLFVEADADIELEQVSDPLQQGFPYLAKLLQDVPGSDGIVGCPLLLIQVTRFQCGGFAFAVGMNHTMSDGSGLIQFLNAIAEFAQGKAGFPSVTPVWQREVLCSRNPSRVTCLHNEYGPELDLEDQSNGDGNETMINRCFFFGTKEIGALRSHLPPQKRTRCTRFEIITACIWKCRTIALGIGPNESVRISSIINGRGKAGLDIPDGYYGNVFVYPASVSKAETVSKYPLEYVVELVKKTRSQAIDGEYFMSVADLMVTRGRPLYTRKGNFIISNTAQLGFDKVDFGWGKPVYGGPAEAVSLISFFSSFRDNERGDGILTAICLPGSAMQRFEDELKKMTKDALRDVNGHIPARIASKL
ncbi:alcohol acyltransferase 16-like [Diospyros lotus]|uniref:alcohol acyltransferase 16-like n=1 Tax=Diospyros lotus TaxID=55363 RepID=UPI00224F13E0|nr:alcohol acyltransferase 16-like [Diospyros lotus]